MEELSAELSAEIISLLNEELLGYSFLHRVLIEEKNCLILNNFNRLNETLKRKEMEINKIRCIEMRLHTVLEDIKIKAGMTKSKFTFEQLLKMIDKTYQDRLKNTWIGLEKLSYDIRDLNKRNKNIVEQLLTLVRDSFSLLSNIATTSPIYYKTGRMDNPAMSGNLFCGSI